MRLVTGTPSSKPRRKAARDSQRSGRDAFHPRPKIALVAGKRMGRGWNASLPNQILRNWRSGGSGERRHWDFSLRRSADAPLRVAKGRLHALYLYDCFDHLSLSRWSRSMLRLALSSFHASRPYSRKNMSESPSPSAAPNSYNTVVSLKCS